MIVLEHFATSSLLSDTSNQNIFHSLSPTTTTTTTTTTTVTVIVTTLLSFLIPLRSHFSP
jgi:hypothetical protein